MSESDAVERILAKERGGLIPEPKTEEELLDERDPDSEPIEEPEAQVEGDEFDDDGQEVEVDEPSSTADPVVKFDDGTELPLSEVKRGFLRQADYTRKTQETAELRKSVEAERSQFHAERKAVADRLTPLIQAAEAIVNNPATQQELAELRAVDPGAYAVRVMEMQQRAQTLQRLQYEQAQLRETAEREEAERFQRERAETAQRSRATLMETIPEAKKDFAGWYSALGKWVLEQGIPAELWDNEVDHRVITLAYKAMKYDQATRKTPATTDKLRKAPQPLRPGTAKPPGYAQQRSLREATERAYQSGSIEDMAKLQEMKIRSARR